MFGRDDYYYHDDHHLECPRCGQHNVVSQGENKYACLSCRWRRDLSNNPEPPLFLLIVLAVIILILMTA